MNGKYNGGKQAVFFENQILFLSLTIIQQILFARNYSTESFISGKSRPTRRALEAGDSAHISSSFLRLSIFLAGQLRRPRPSAGNAGRQPAETI